MSGKINLYQIFYDNASKATLERGYIPLDNTRNERPDWYELWPIRNFLLNNRLDPDAWYGFFSPRFNEKTGIEFNHVHHFVSYFKDQAEVTFFPRSWCHIAYFRNVFIHGDLEHPGLLEMAACFLNDQRINLDLAELVTHSGNAVYSNNVVAKPKYWKAWLDLANAFYDYVEEGKNSNARAIQKATSYGARQAPMKAFVQERLSAVLIQLESFRVATLDTSVSASISDLFQNEVRSRRLLQVCDQLKQDFTKSNDINHLELYEKLCQLIPHGPRMKNLLFK